MVVRTTKAQEMDSEEALRRAPNDPAEPIEAAAGRAKPLDHNAPPNNFVFGVRAAGVG